MEVQVCHLELELRIAVRLHSALLVLCHKAEVGWSAQVWVWLVGAYRRVDIPAASDKPALGVVDYDVLVTGDVARPGSIIQRQAQSVDTRLGAL